MKGARLHFFLGLVVLSLIPDSLTLKVFNFENTDYSPSTEDDNIPLATVLLPNQPLTDFVVCSSIKWTSMLYPGLYDLLDSSEDNFLRWTLDTSTSPDTLFGIVGSLEVYYIMAQRDFQPDTWYHICLHLDSGRQKLEAAIDGEVTARLEGVTGLGQSEPVTLSLGETVTNLHLFRADPSMPSLADLSRDLCRQTGDLLAWDTTVWTKTGNWSSQLEVELEPESVCNNKTRYPVALGIFVSQDQGLRTCAKLEGGTLGPDPHTSEELETFIDWYIEETLDTCFNIWTPFSDQKTEGKFLSLVDGSSPVFLPWAPNFGNIGPKANSVVIYHPDRLTPYADVGSDQKNCISCSLPRNLTLKIMGLCLESKLGEQHTNNVSYILSYFRPTVCFKD